MICIYPTENQSVPSGAVAIAIANRLSDGSLEIVAGHVYSRTVELADKVAPYIDAILAGKIEARKSEPEAPIDAEALALSLLGLPRGPWQCRGRCGSELDWPGICPSCYDSHGIVDKRPLDAYGSVALQYRRCRFDSQDWQRGIKQEALSAALELSKQRVSIEIQGERAVQLGVAIFHERVKLIRNNNDARFLRSEELTVDSIRQHRERPLLCLDTPDPRIATVLSKSTSVIACNCINSGIAEKIKLW